MLRFSRPFSLVYQSQGVLKKVESRGRRREHLGLCLQKSSNIDFIVFLYPCFSHLFALHLINSYPTNNSMFYLTLVFLFEGVFCLEKKLFVQIIIFLFF